MPGCATRCTTYSTDSMEAAWTDIRAHFGPVVAWSTTEGSLARTDVLTWEAWATSKGISTSNIVMFGKWLIWKCSYGTVEYGNLPTRKRDHEGISCIPCPYSDSSDDTRTRLWLGLDESDPIPTQSAHGEYYMKVSQRGNSWGFECTSDACSYFLTTGKRYFHA